MEVGPLRLVQFGDDEDPLAVKGAWWSGRTGGLVGGLTGGLLGCLGALVGVPLFSLRSLRRRYEEVELRRMRALDAR